MKILTTRIATIRARAAAEAAKYTIEAWDATYPAFTVAHITDTDRKYTVDLNFQSCDCPAFKRENYCKHCAMCQQERAYLANLEAQAAAQAQAEERAFEAFMHREYPAVPC